MWPMISDRWKAIVKAVKNRQFLQNTDISWLAENLLASQKRFCYMGIVGRRKQSWPIWSYQICHSLKKMRKIIKRLTHGIQCPNLISNCERSEYKLQASSLERSFPLYYYYYLILCFVFLLCSLGSWFAPVLFCSVVFCLCSLCNWSLCHYISM
jgi:hypothetical protein